MIEQVEELHVVISEEFELQSFPFDSQDLQIVLCVSHENGVIISPTQIDPFVEVDNAFSSGCDWSTGRLLIR